MSERKNQDAQEGGLALRTAERVRKPPLYNVVLHNDDYTPQGFVVYVLHHVFRVTHDEAQALMLTAHREGQATVMQTTLEIAESLVEEAMEEARTHEFPLTFTLEPDAN